VLGILCLSQSPCLVKMVESSAYFCFPRTSPDRTIGKFHFFGDSPFWTFHPHAWKCYIISFLTIKQTTPGVRFLLIPPLSPNRPLCRPLCFPPGLLNNSISYRLSSQNQIAFASPDRKIFPSLPRLSFSLLFLPPPPPTFSYNIPVK